ncbi:MAG TPA: O-antigen ligase family protein [Pyrinomonadaceae bacterium]|nr:O-antigen ligase family protein [Pyrinomonadaceae bacterium]
MAQLGQRIALGGMVLYVVSAPHSIAAAEISIAISALGWLIRTVGTGTTGLRRSRFDLLILLFLVWTLISSIWSAEPSISVPKFQSSWVVFLFYLTRAIVKQRTVLLLVGILIISGATGVLYSLYDLARGRGVIVESLIPNSPFEEVGIQPGDAIWRINGQRVYSVADIDEAIRSAPPDQAVAVSIISRGEHVERRASAPISFPRTPSVTSGVTGSSRTHRFRASGWTRHYETFSELLQIIAQLALGITLANLSNHGVNKAFRIGLLLAAILAVGIVLTAMRTVLIAFVIGASVIAWRASRGLAKVILTFALFFVLAFGAVVVWQTRADNALSFADPSASLRGQVARVGLSRVLLHPILGHGMDAMKRHWTEWGFPGTDMIHLHSTPLQLAFDRGLPALVLWLWLMIEFWLYFARASRKASEVSETNAYGVLLGGLGALTGFLASSMVNYNFGDAEVALLFWWLMGILLVLSTDYTDSTSNALKVE